MVGVVIGKNFKVIEFKTIKNNRVARTNAGNAFLKSLILLKTPVICV